MWHDSASAVKTVTTESTYDFTQPKKINRNIFVEYFAEIFLCYSVRAVLTNSWQQFSR